jgi:hypothetical protein
MPVSDAPFASKIAGITCSRPIFAVDKTPHLIIKLVFQFIFKLSSA